MKIPQRITDLTRRDFEELAAATNPRPGIGITVRPTGVGFEISIDETQFKRMLWAFNANGGFTVKADKIDEVPLDIST